MISPNRAAHVLILGCGRSGTSIFGELFEHLPSYSYLSEPAYEEIKQLDYSTPQAFKVPRESPAYPPSPGLSFPLEDLLVSIPRPLKIFWQLRHPLDTICSLRVGISRNWGHHPRPHDWQSWLSRPLLEQCAHHWNYLNTVGYQQIAPLATVCTFEQMIADPMAFATEICAKIGLAADSCQEELASWSKRVQNTNNQQFVEAETSKAYSTRDHKVRVERWKENLSPEQVRQISPMIEETARSFGYEWQAMI
ncbi:MAG: sulfotransferase domain-containing protein [Bacteroidota bacterium]